MTPENDAGSPKEMMAPKGAGKKVRRGDGGKTAGMEGGSEGDKHSWGKKVTTDPWQQNDYHGP